MHSVQLGFLCYITEQTRLLQLITFFREKDTAQTFAKIWQMLKRDIIMKKYLLLNGAMKFAPTAQITKTVSARKKKK